GGRLSRCTASGWCAGDRCDYRRVIVIVLCPISSCAHEPSAGLHGSPHTAAHPRQPTLLTPVTLPV
ncbi:MAG TPA: hypothetical protein VF515_04015, partial [Candidatus Binatia bacterium]